MKYYSGARLLSQKDVNGEKPEIFISNTNRSSGKTTYFNRLALRRFLKGEGQFYLNYRVAVESGEVANSFYNGIQQFFPGMEMTQKTVANGKLVKLFIDGDLCGFAIPLTAAEYVKKLSHLFADVTFGVFDEFQSETGNYLPGEVNNFISIHQSVARGGGSMARYVPVVMISNLASTLNPYYRALGIRNADLIGSNFFRGDGFVVERRTVEEAKEALRAQAFNRAFSQGDNRYAASMTGDGELLDCTTFVEPKPDGRGEYLCNIVAYGRKFALTYFPSCDILYVAKGCNPQFPVAVTALPSDLASNVQDISAQKNIELSCKRYWRNSRVRFQTVEGKDAFLTLI